MSDALDLLIYLDEALTKNLNSLVIDGFIVSDNIKSFRAENLDANFVSSDHNPVALYFILE